MKERWKSIMGRAINFANVGASAGLVCVRETVEEERSGTWAALNKIVSTSSSTKHSLHS